ncbi:hypothetical protein Acr_29g0010480 [Actinidia rufa]|uniref:Uncharacterized protein n=1 Tax=Actinidia rufa TaxID=165716 RepID=A0A7J0HFI0_9ERIC|nr:hypothetical protein Acr_29g0010480 [Actinidia rufa]
MSPIPNGEAVLDKSNHASELTPPLPQPLTPLPLVETKLSRQKEATACGPPTLASPSRRVCRVNQKPYPCVGIPNGWHMCKSRTINHLNWLQNPVEKEMQLSSLDSELRTGIPHCETVVVLSEKTLHWR